MGRVRIVRNDLPKIESKLHDATMDGVTKAGEELVTELKSALWHYWGYAERSTQTYPLAGGIAVGVGRHGTGSAGWGFYVGYREFGSAVTPARPVVVPTAHAFEPKFGEVVAAEVRKVL